MKTWKKIQQSKPGLLASLLLVGFFLGSMAPVQGQTLLSPVHGYVSAEPFQIRREYVLTLAALDGLLGFDPVRFAEIDADEREVLKRMITAYLDGKSPVSVDGFPLSMELESIHFIARSETLGLVEDKRDLIPLGDALVGVTYGAATDGPPELIEVIWEVFPPGTDPAILDVGVRDQMQRFELYPGRGKVKWTRQAPVVTPELLKLPAPPDLEEVPVPTFPALGAGCLLVAAIAGLTALVRKEKASAWLGLVVLAGVAGGVVLWNVGRIPLGTPASVVEPVTDEEADEIVYALLRNIYHSFDYRKESDIYDTLDRSAEGELLTQIYLEVRRSLELENQGGARVRIQNVDLRDCKVEDPAPGGEVGFVAACEWVAVGEVTHWGHTHDRVNRYFADLTVHPVEGQWKLTALEMEKEERLEQVVKSLQEQK